MEPFDQNGKEVKPNFNELQDKHRNFKKGTEVHKHEIPPLVGPLVERNIFLSSPTRKPLIFVRHQFEGYARANEPLYCIQ
jgi:hypothetical protein